MDNYACSMCCVEIWMKPHGMCDACAGKEIDKLRRQVEAHCERIVGQSELLSKAAANSTEREKQAFNDGLKAALMAMQRRAGLHQIRDNKAPAHDVLREIISELKELLK